MKVRISNQVIDNFNSYKDVEFYLLNNLNKKESAVVMFSNNRVVRHYFYHNNGNKLELRYFIKK